MHCAKRSKAAERLLVAGIVATGVATFVVGTALQASADEAHVTKVDGTTETFAQAKTQFTPGRWRVNTTEFTADNIFINACDVRIARRGALRGTCGSDLPVPPVALSGRLRLRGDGTGTGSFKAAGFARCSRVVFAVTDNTLTGLFACRGSVGNLTGVRVR